MSAIAPLRIEVPAFREPTAQPAFSALKTSPWFSAFPQASLQALAMCSSLRSYSAGQPVLQENKPTAFALLVVKGRVRGVKRSEGGREMALETRRAGEILTDGLLDPDGAVANDWVAAETSLLLFLPKDEFLAQLRSVPEAAMGLLRDFESRLNRAKGLACDLALADVQTRLFRALERLAREDGEPCPEGTLVRRCPTQQEIGNEIGACRETVSRMIAELARQQLVTLKGRSLFISPQFLARAFVTGAA